MLKNSDGIKNVEEPSEHSCQWSITSTYPRLQSYEIKLEYPKILTIIKHNPQYLLFLQFQSRNLVCDIWGIQGFWAM